MGRAHCDVDRLVADKAWIVKTAVSALSDLVDREFKFTEIQLPDDFFEEDVIIKSDDDGVVKFINEHTTTEEAAFASTDDLYNAYQDVTLCVQVNKDTFSKKVSKMFGTYRGKKGDLRGYKGIKII